MNDADRTKELIQSVFEGLIGLAVVIGAGYVVSTHPDSTALVGLAGTFGGMVLSFYYGQRGNQKVLDGNMSALTSIASQVSTAREFAATNTRESILQAQRPAVVVQAPATVSVPAPEEPPRIITP